MRRAFSLALRIFRHVLRVSPTSRQSKIDTVSRLATNPQMQTASPAFCCAASRSNRAGFPPFQFMITSPVRKSACVAGLSASTLRTTARPLAVALHRKSQRRASTSHCCAIPNPPFQHLAIRQRFRAGDVLLEKILERSARDFFRGQPHVQAVAIRFPCLAKSSFICRITSSRLLLIVRAVANQNIQQHAENLALGVVRHAVFRADCTADISRARHPGSIAPRSASDSPGVIPVR